MYPALADRPWISGGRIWASGGALLRARVMMPMSGVSRTPSRQPLRGRQRPASVSPGIWVPGGGCPGVDARTQSGGRDLEIFQPHFRTFAVGLFGMPPTDVLALRTQQF